MKGLNLTSCAILITIGLFSLQTQLVSGAFTMSETCQYVTKGWIADPRSCQNWGYCEGGKLISTGKCKDGFMYNSKTGNCAPADKVACTSNVVDACKKMATPTMIADPNDCTNYCYCNGKGGYECSKCPPFQFYDPTRNTCVWESEYNCPAYSICRLVPNNEIVGDPNMCGNFVTCLEGYGFSHSCDVGLLYDSLSGECQSSKNPCDDGSSSAGPGVKYPLWPDPSRCSQYVPGVQFFSDRTTCMGYYVCDSQYGPGYWAKCPFGTHFDETTQQCVTPYTINCPYDRCGNTGLEFVTAAGTHCESYYMCKDQTRQGQGGTCPPQYPFFNEVIGACNSLLPDYQICVV